MKKILLALLLFSWSWVVFSSPQTVSDSETSGLENTNQFFSELISKVLPNSKAAPSVLLDQGQLSGLQFQTSQGVYRLHFNYSSEGQIESASGEILDQDGQEVLRKLGTVNIQDSILKLVEESQEVRTDLEELIEAKKDGSMGGLKFKTKLALLAGKVAIQKDQYAEPLALLSKKLLPVVPMGFLLSESNPEDFESLDKNIEAQVAGEMVGHAIVKGHHIKTQIEELKRGIAALVSAIVLMVLIVVVGFFAVLFFFPGVGFGALLALSMLVPF